MTAPATPTLAEAYPLLAAGLAMLTRFVNMTPMELAQWAETVSPEELAELFESRGDVLLALEQHVHPFIDTVARARMMVEGKNLLERAVRAHPRESAETRARVGFLSAHAGCCLMPEPQWSASLRKREEEVERERKGLIEDRREAVEIRDQYRALYEALRRRTSDGILVLPPAPSKSARTRTSAKRRK